MGQIDLKNMTYGEFDEYMRNRLDAFKEEVKTNPNYQFARNGETQALGDWFEQWAMRENLI